MVFGGETTAMEDESSDCQSKTMAELSNRISALHNRMEVN